MNQFADPNINLKKKIKSEKCKQLKEKKIEFIF